ncbi:MAG: dethiobiotin synthase [Nitrosopumilus sp. H13]|nr:MAG: dethiobiotin synthase [Nitrosopumilus sp. H13]
MESLFVSGTDTDVGKTYVAAGLAAAFHGRGIDVGVMKPFAAGDAQKTGFKSLDAQILASAAHTNDPEHLVNPQFFPIPASPYTAWKNLGIKAEVETALSSFEKLEEIHQTVIVEGMGGIMTPIRSDYCMADMIKDMGIPAVIVASGRIGTINHTVLTANACKKYEIPVKGVIINRYDGGYDADELGRDLHDLLGVDVLGVVPHISLDDDLPRIFSECLDLDRLV